MMLICLLCFSVLINAQSTQRKCNSVEGTLDGCHECYPCDHKEVLLQKRAGVTPSEIKLYNSSCLPTKVCCISKWAVIASRSGEDCGRKGAGKGQRKSPRTILQQEYPWIASVYEYKNSNHKLLCFATFIDENYQTLAAPASCVGSVAAKTLRVSFDFAPQFDKMAAVGRVIVHENYDQELNTNGIALLKLKDLSEIPAWAQPTCLPEQGVKIDSHCFTVSSKYNTIHETPIANQQCRQSKRDGTILCALSSLIENQTPQFGAGLYCLNQVATVVRYDLRGIFLKKDGGIDIYINIYNLLQWIRDKREL